MKVLWVSNLIAAEGENLADPTRATYGGWIANMLAALAATGAHDLSLLVRCPGTRRLVLARHNGVAHLYVPTRGGTFEPTALRAALTLAAPDTLHIEGAEMAHAADAAEAFDGPVVVSVQGVVHGLAPYEYGGLPVARWALGWHRPARALTATAMIAARSLRFRPRLAAERRTMARADRVVGRTVWDRAFAAELAPGVPYRHVARILRPAFHAAPAAAPVPHRLFLGNAHHARKGAHIVVAALAMLRRRYPDAHLAIAGAPPTRAWRDRIGYRAELMRQIEAAGLVGAVRYTGLLDAERMAAEMLRADVVVVSSLIENSPNTLGEAMMLGRPIVCAYAGGAPDMAAPDREALFYRAREPVGLAHQVGRLFDDRALAARLGAAASARARRTHDPATNRDALLALYAEIAAGTTRAAPATRLAA
ncbi:MAG: hypothetical protein AcusKO_34840 [Acuticoccus sp.]